MFKKWGMLLDEYAYNVEGASARAKFVSWMTMALGCLLVVGIFVAALIGMFFLFVYNWVVGLLFVILALFIPVVVAVITYKPKPDINKDIPVDIEDNLVNWDEW
jgi:MFS family permease